LAQDARRAGPQPQRRAHALRPHPPRDVTPCMARFGRDDVQLRKARLVRGAVTEVAIDGIDPRALVIEDGEEARQAIAARRGERPGIACIRRALRREHAGQTG
jgi:hypothetical protein